MCYIVFLCLLFILFKANWIVSHHSQNVNMLELNFIVKLTSNIVALSVKYLVKKIVQKSSKKVLTLCLFPYIIGVAYE